MITDDGVLFIEPSGRTSDDPLIDKLTRKMVAAYRLSTSVNPTRGFHTCKCGAWSDNCEHRLPNGELTNSLCIHYLAFHRDEVSVSQLRKIEALCFGEAKPNNVELRGMGFKEV